MEIKNSIGKITRKLSINNLDAQNSLNKKTKNGVLDNILNHIELKKSKLYKIGWSYLQNHHDIEDVFQVTIIQMYENIYQLREEKYLDTWMTAIFINECKRLLKYKKKNPVIKNIDIIEGSSLIDDSCIMLTEALKKLDEIHREVIVLKYISGYSQEEISDILKIPLGTVKSRLYRGLRALKEEIYKEV